MEGFERKKSADVIRLDDHRGAEALDKVKQKLVQKVRNDFVSIQAREADGLNEYLIHNKRIKKVAVERGMRPEDGVDVERMEREIPIMLQQREDVLNGILQSINQAQSQQELQHIEEAYAAEVRRANHELAELEEANIKGRSFT